MPVVTFVEYVNYQGDSYLHQLISEIDTTSITDIIRHIEHVRNAKKMIPTKQLSEFHYTPLQLSICVQRLEVFSSLLDVKEIDISKCDFVQHNCTHLIAIHLFDDDALNFFEVLLANRGTIEFFNLANQFDHSGYNVFHLLVKKYSNKCVEFFCNLGVDLNVRTLGKGKTALHLAVQRDLVEMVSLLLRHGADKNGLDNGGLLPMQYTDWPMMHDVLEGKEY